MLKQGVTAGGADLMLKDLKPNGSLILSAVGRLNITRHVIIDLTENLFFCFQNSAAGFKGLITRTNEDGRENDGLIFLLNTFNHLDMNANIFFIHYISVASRLTVSY